MRLGQLFKTASFRLVAAYAGLFSISAGILAAVIYFTATSEMQQEIRMRIVADSRALEGEYARGGLQQLLDSVTDRQRNRLVGGLDFSVVSARGNRLFGNLSVAHCLSGWEEFTGPPDGDEPSGQMEKLGVLITPLPGGECLLVGDDVGRVATFGSIILKSFSWVFVFSVTLALAGGVFLSSRVLRQIETISITAEAIIAGDLNRRIPRRGAPDDLDRLAATLNRMLDRMTGLMDAVRHVSNDIAHDLRTPLGRLRHTLEEAKRSTSSPDEVRAAVEGAVTEVDGILETFGAILRIAQIESGSRRSGFRRLQLSSLVMEVCETFAPSMEEVGKSLKTCVEPNAWILGDPELLVQSLANLLENAIAHTPAGVLVTVSLAFNQDEIELNVADNGQGVPESLRSNIFKRFYRVDQSRSSAGNGLGLSIVAAVAELHDAKICAEDNKPGLKVTMAFSAAA